MTDGDSSLVSRANKLFMDGRYGEALGLYQDAARRHPDLLKTLAYNMSACEEKLAGQARPPAPAAGRGDAPLDGRVMACVASIPSRVHGLERVVASLLPQCDRLGVYLNGYDSVPAFLLKDKITVATSQAHGDIGDIGKFFWVDDWAGYYLTCDDDIDYPGYYVERIVQKLRQYAHKAVCGWHGSLILAPFEDFYDPKYRRVLAFGSERARDTPAHVLGTGCLGFHRGCVDIRRGDFDVPNMADIYFALRAQRLAIPLIVIEHRAGELKEIPDTQDTSIYRHSKEGKATQSDTGARQTAMVKQHAPWRIHYADQSLRIALVGRFKTHPKGGINKSCHLISRLLREGGHRVAEVDLDAGDMAWLAEGLDFVWIYPPDPERPDFAQVEDFIQAAQRRRVAVAVNLSLNGVDSRAGFIVDAIQRYNADPRRSPVFLATFSDMARLDPRLAPIAGHLLQLHKTIDLAPLKDIAPPRFADSEGIFIGDLSKAMNPLIAGENPLAWLQAIRNRMPYANLYAMEHYKLPPGVKAPDYVRLVPYLGDKLFDFIAKRRIVLCLNIHTTFEMVPVEAAGLGVPVAHRDMPQSLSEYLGPVSLKSNSPEEMAFLCERVYNDESLWTRISAATRRIGSAVDVKFLSAHIETQIRRALFTAAARQSAAQEPGEKRRAPAATTGIPA